MASSDLRRELDCSICLSLYTDPVMLTCGHNFCRTCIGRVLDTQEEVGHYSCPECREEFWERPTLHRNVTLRNVVEALGSSQPDQEETGIFCTYCVDFSVPAVKFCLHCEASLCDKHVRAHNKAPEHHLTSPNAAQGKKCSVHKKILEYYCTRDAELICVSCCLVGTHKGHQVESLDEASKKKKDELRDVMQKSLRNREDIEKTIQSLQEQERQEKETAADVTEKVTGLFRDHRKTMEDLERRVLREISWQTEQASLSVSNQICQLEVKKDELSSMMGSMEKMCNSSDPHYILQKSGDLVAQYGDQNRYVQSQHGLQDMGNLVVLGISQILSTLSSAFNTINWNTIIIGTSHISLDANTAGNVLQISQDRKMASPSNLTARQNYVNPCQLQIDKDPQVLSIESFSSGRHYWDVDISKCKIWRVGICYRSVGRLGTQLWQYGVQHSFNRSQVTRVTKQNWQMACSNVEPPLTSSNSSWWLYRNGNQYGVMQNSQATGSFDAITGGIVRIYLDYKAGQISFYDVCDSIRLLHTFTDAFTEPLYAALCVWQGSITICGDT